MKKTIKLPYWNHNTAYFPWILKHLPANAQVLDVGCGDGTLVYYLSDSVNKVVGLDSYAACIEGARIKYGTVANIHFICSSFEEYEAEEQYDAIIFFASLHHMNMSETIRKAKDYLRQNGVMLIVGLASPAGLTDYILEGIRLLPSAILSRLHRMKTSEEIGVPTSYEMSSMKEIRKVVNAELPGAHIQYGLHYRYLLNWRKNER